MAKLKFDGTKLKDGGRLIATVRGDKICAKTSYTAEVTIRKDAICEKTGYKKLATLRKNDLCQGTGYSKLISLDDIDDEIEGPGGITKAALWFCFVR
jgi:hypothetical protein